MKLFVSYSRRDANAMESLIRGLKVLGHDVWIDQELTGGVEWWNAILERIREADAFVAVVSMAALNSVACSRERVYAVSLGKSVVPVLVERVPPQLLPPELAQRQLIDYVTPDESAAFALMGGIARLPVASPLPDPLPPPPEVPMSYLSDISRQLHEQSLSRDQQLTIAMRLKEAAAREEDYDAARELAATLGRREDLYAVTQRQLDDVLTSPRPVGSVMHSTDGQVHDSQPRQHSTPPSQKPAQQTHPQDMKPRQQESPANLPAPAEDRPKTGRLRWGGSDLVKLAAVGIVCAVLLALVRAWSSNSFVPLLFAVATGAWVIAGVMGGLIIGKPGAAVGAELIAVVLSLIGEGGFEAYIGVVLVYGVVHGLGAELIFAVFRYRDFRVHVAILAGLGGALARVTMGGEWDSVGYTLLSLLSGAILGGALPWTLVRSLRISPKARSH